MEDIHINMVAILVAVVANFFLGFLWYTPLFGKMWAREMGVPADAKAPAGALVKGMVFMVIGNFLMAFVFAHNIAAWSFVPGTAQLSDMQNALMAAGFTWLGFFLPQDLSAVAWENRSWKFFFINAGYHLVALMLVAFILVYMK